LRWVISLAWKWRPESARTSTKWEALIDAGRDSFYLRHGETDWNRAHRAQGHTDIPLNATGIAQARAAVAPLLGCAIATICTSPLARARVTAEIVNQRLRRPLVVIDALKECGLGVHEGEPRGDWFRAWRRGDTPDGAEPYEAFIARARRHQPRAGAARPGPDRGACRRLLGGPAPRPARPGRPAAQWLPGPP
jgi:hypothetical protein